ncbi:PIN domain nuclease [Candidatus Woesearchaeota archaeon CG10_big_fil_rev_8_21_14_0_10_44_13]|nr:MAG: PIN domain nuclease [Candidatus Woesearchaeota archaeon CG10_big_fil_rev_8_21_14_0_10_44_13]
MKYFLDTYALVEITKGNKNFEGYIESDAITLRLNMAELYHSTLSDFNEKTADYFFKLFARLTFELPPDIIPKAIKFRKLNNKKNLSYADCLGYIFARDNHRIFVTGDKAFEGMEGVAFVK